MVTNSQYIVAALILLGLNLAFYGTYLVAGENGAWMTTFGVVLGYAIGRGTAK